MIFGRILADEYDDGGGGGGEFDEAHHQKLRLALDAEQSNKMRPCTPPSSTSILINRDVFTQESFDELYGAQEVDFSVAGRIRTNVKQILANRGQAAKSWMKTCFPPFQWLPEYNWKRDIVQDLIAGLTVGIMNIPQGMAYGMLTGLPPVYGLYTSFYIPILYAFLGTSRHMSVGTFAVISLMVATAVDNVAPLTKAASNITDSNSTEPATSSILSWFCGASSFGMERDMNTAVDAAITLTFLVGICQIALGLMHMGFLSVYLSDQLVEGLTTGAAILVFTSQISQVFGIKNVPQANGVLGVLKFYGCLLTKLGEVNWATFITSCICILALVLVKELIEPSFKKRFKFPIPVELFIIIITTVTSYFAGLGTSYSVKVVGEIPTGLKPPRLPSISLMPQLIPNAISTSIVIFSIGISMGKLFSKKHDYEISANQEWFAMGFTHLISSFFWCHCGGSSLSRSLVQEQQGSKSQIASIFAACLILIVLLALGPLFRDLPTCALAAIIVVNLKGMFLQFRKLPPLWSRSKADFLIWLVSFVAVVLLDISFGLLVAVLFALLTVVFRSQWPDSVCLGRLPNTELYKGLNAYKHAVDISGIKIYRFDSHLYFANADLFKEELNLRTGVDVVKEKAKRRKRMAKNAHRDPTRSDASLAELCTLDTLRAIIIDCSSFPYVDMMGLGALRQVYEDYSFLGIQVAFACVKVSVRQMMTKSGFFERVPKSSLFPSVHDSVMALSASQVSTPPPSPTVMSDLKISNVIKF